MFGIPTKFGHLAIQRCSFGDPCCTSALYRMRISDGHINEESFVVVGRTGNNVEDGVSLRRGKERDDTLDINLKVQPSKLSGRCALECSMRSLSCRSAVAQLEVGMQPVHRSVTSLACSLLAQRTCMVGLCRCASHSDCRTATGLSICRSLPGSKYAAPFAFFSLAL